MKTTVKGIILTAIYYKGLDAVKNDIQQLADWCLCSPSYVRKIVNAVSNGLIVVTK